MFILVDATSSSSTLYVHFDGCDFDFIYIVCSFWWMRLRLHLHCMFILMDATSSSSTLFILVDATSSSSILYVHFD